jgi:hypothetical protein
MGLVPGASFERSLRRLDRETLTAFVADLYAARGIETRTRDNYVHLRRSTGVETLVVAPDRSTRRELLSGTLSPRSRFTLFSRSTAPKIPDQGNPSTEDVDGIVTIDGTDPNDELHRYIGPKELQRILLYGIDRDDAERLCRQYFDQSLSAFVDSPAADESITWQPRHVGVVVVGLLLITAAVVASVPGGSNPDIDANATDGDTQTNGITDGADDIEQNGSSEESSPDPGIDGLSAGGITNASAIAAGHREQIHGRSYRITVRGRGRILPIQRTYATHTGPLPKWGRLNQRVAVEQTGIYRSKIMGSQRNTNNTAESVVRDEYMDGVQIYRRVDSGDEQRYQRVNATPKVVTGFGASIERYLTTTNSSVHPIQGGGFRVVATGSPTMIDGPTPDYLAVAIIDESGLVRDLEVSYLDPEAPAGNDRLNYLHVSIDRIGRQHVDRPSWYSQARNETGTSGHPTGIDLASDDGDVVPVALAATHRATIRDRRYRWEVDHYGPHEVNYGPHQTDSVDWRATLSHRRVSVESPRRFSAHVYGVFVLNGSTIPTAFEQYADGKYVYRRIKESPPTAYSRNQLSPGERDQFADTAERYVRRYLATDRVTVRTVDDGPIRYRITATGTPERIDDETRSFRAVANVTADGLVRDLRVRYVLVTDDGSTEVRIVQTYSEVGTATVDEPGWYGDARRSVS